MKTKILFVLLFIIGTSVNAAAVKDKYVSVELLPEVTSVEPGKTFTMALKVVMDEGWHTYWKNPGVGLPIKIKWDLPAGVTAGEIQWPTPHIYTMQGINNYGYGNEAWLLTDISVPADMAGELKINASVSWLMCKTSCVPGRAKISSSVAVGKHQVNADLTKQFEAARANIPSAATDWKITKKSADDQSLVLSIQPVKGKKVNPLKEVYFFSEDKKVINSDAIQTLKKTSSGYELTLTRDKKPLPEVLNGILQSKDFSARAGGYAVEIKI